MTLMDISSSGAEAIGANIPYTVLLWGHLSAISGSSELVEAPGPKGVGSCSVTSAQKACKGRGEY